MRSVNIVSRDQMLPPEQNTIQNTLPASQPRQLSQLPNLSLLSSVLVYLSFTYSFVVSCPLPPSRVCLSCFEVISLFAAAGAGEKLSDHFSNTDLSPVFYVRRGQVVEGSCTDRP